MNKIDKFLQKSLDKMFQCVGFASFDKEFVKQDNWYSLREWDTQQAEGFKQWFLKECRKDLKCTKRTAEKEYSWFNLKWGWKEV